MKTIKLPIQNKIDIDEIQRIFSSCIRFCYNRFQEKLLEKDIRNIIKSKKLFQKLDSWFIQSAIYDAKSLFSTNKEKIIFGILLLML